MTDVISPIEVSLRLVSEKERSVKCSTRSSTRFALTVAIASAMATEGSGRLKWSAISVEEQHKLALHLGQICLVNRSCF
jgi:hypothetical protein